MYVELILEEEPAGGPIRQRCQFRLNKKSPRISENTFRKIVIEEFPEIQTPENLLFKIVPLSTLNEDDR